VVDGVTKTHVGLGNVDNTSDANKPISTATTTALGLKAPSKDPVFTGVVDGVTKTHVGLGNVDNTSDANKPISTAAATALALKAPSKDPTFTGVPKAATAAANTDSTQIATTAFVKQAVSTTSLSSSNTDKLALITVQPITVGNSTVNGMKLTNTLELGLTTDNNIPLVLQDVNVCGLQVKTQTHSLFTLIDLQTNWYDTFATTGTSSTPVTNLSLYNKEGKARVGIGISEPYTELCVKGSDNGGISILRNNVDNYNWRIFNSAQNMLKFQAYNGNTTTKRNNCTNVLCLNDDGRVGIGKEPSTIATEAGGEKLQVEGNISATKFIGALEGNATGNAQSATVVSTNNTLSNNHLTNQLTISSATGGGNFTVKYHGSIIYDSNSWILYYHDTSGDSGNKHLKMIRLLITEYKGNLYINVEEAKFWTTESYDATKVKEYWDNNSTDGNTFPSTGGYGITTMDFLYFGTTYTVSGDVTDITIGITDITTGVISDWTNTGISHKSLKVDGNIKLSGILKGDGVEQQIKTYKTKQMFLISGDSTKTEQTGYTVTLSKDGSTMAVSSPYANVAGQTNAGYIKIYEKGFYNTWNFVKKFEGIYFLRRLGASVDFNRDGSVMIVGGVGIENARLRQGVVEYYKKDAGVWSRFKRIDNDSKDNFGVAVSLSDAPLPTNQNSADLFSAISSSHITTSAGDYRGKITVYKYDYNTSKFEVFGTITNLSDVNYFGSRMSLNGDGSIVTASGPYTVSPIVQTYKYDIGTTAWITYGLPLRGSSSDQLGFGLSSSKDGLIIAVGAPLSDVNGTDSGKVEVYKYTGNSTAWAQVGDTIKGAAAGDEFGASVSLSDDGKTLVVGAPKTGTDAGTVSMYTNINDVWHKLTTDQVGGIDSQSGFSVSLSGDGKFYAVGEPKAAGGSGTARIYENKVLENNNILVENAGITCGLLQTDIGVKIEAGADKKHLQIIDTVGCGMGTKLATSGTVTQLTFQTSWYDTYVTTNYPSSYIDNLTLYNKSGTTSVGIGTTTPTEKLEVNGNVKATKFIGNVTGNLNGNSATGSVLETRTIDAIQIISDSKVGDLKFENLLDSVDLSAETSSNSGCPLSLSGNGLVMAVGYSEASDTSNKQGRVQVYEYKNYVWGQIGLNIHGGSIGDQLGFSVSLNGDGTVLAVGIFYSDSDQLTNNGAVKVYKFNGTAWNILGTVIAGTIAESYFGSSVSLSDDGMTVAIGAQEGESGTKGELVVYNYENGVWNQKGSTISGLYVISYTGSSVSLSSDGLTVAVGASRDNANGANAGAFAVFSYVNDEWVNIDGWQLGPVAEAKTGYSVSLSSDGSTIAVGSPKSTTSGIAGNGKVDVYSIKNNAFTKIGNSIEGILPGENAGHSVSLSSDGLTVAFGAPYASGKPSIKVYKYVGGVWTEVDGDSTLTESTAISDLGSSISMSRDGSIIAAGAPGTNKIHTYKIVSNAGVLIKSGGKIVKKLICGLDTISNQVFGSGNDFGIKVSHQSGSAGTYVGYGGISSTKTGRLRLGCNNVERMCITDDGRVGIGVIAPYTELCIKSPDNGGISIIRSTSDHNWRIFNNLDNILKFQNYNDSSNDVRNAGGKNLTCANLLCLSDNGRVGIGKVPHEDSAKLQVNGGIELKGAVDTVLLNMIEDSGSNVGMQTSLNADSTSSFVNFKTNNFPNNMTWTNTLQLINKMNATSVKIPGTLDVTGTITGNVTGDVTGDVTGNVTGDVNGGSANKVTTGSIVLNGGTNTDLLKMIDASTVGMYTSLNTGSNGTVINFKTNNYPNQSVLTNTLQLYNKTAGNATSVGIGTSWGVNETHSEKLVIDGNVKAAIFKGALEGNADTSTTCTGNAATASGVAYINLTGTPLVWNQDTTGNAQSATVVSTNNTLSNNHLTNQLTILFTDANPTVGANTSNFNADYQGGIIYDSNSWILYYFDGTFFKMVQLLITEYKGYLYINIEKARAFATGTFDTTKIKHYWDNFTHDGLTSPSAGINGYGIGGINFDYFGTTYTIGAVTDITTGVISDWTNTGISHKSLKVDSLDGNVTGNVTGDVTGNATTSTTCTGNASNATILKTSRKIGGEPFDGSTDIDLPGVNVYGNQDTTGNAQSAHLLKTLRKIGGVNFNGGGDINLPGVNIPGDQNTSGNAATSSACTASINKTSFDSQTITIESGGADKNQSTLILKSTGGVSTSLSLYDSNAAASVAGIRIDNANSDLILFRNKGESSATDAHKLIVKQDKVQIVKQLEVQGSGIVIKDNGNIGSVTKPAAMSIDSRGFIGINCNPSAPLHVNYSHSLSQVNYWQFGGGGSTFGNSTGTVFVTPTAYATPVSIYTAGSIWTLGHVRTSSDSRIKTNIVDVPGTLALQMIRDIPCRYYEHVDKSKGPDKIIGFIAQEVKKVLPMAVSLNKSIIPDVMTVVVGTWDTSHNFSTNSLKDCSGTKYRFYVSNNSDGKDEIMKEIMCNEDGTFTFEEQYANVFCYGKEVDDFHTLDYQKIFTLHHAAIQELDKKHEELDKKLIQVDKKHEELDNTIQELKAELAKLKAV